MAIGLFIGIWKRWLGMELFGETGSMRASVSGTRAKDREEVFRKREAGTDRPVSFGVVPGVLAEAEMTINIPSPKNFCLYEVPLDRLEVGKFQFFLIKSIPSVSSTWAREELSRFFCFYSLKRILWIKERERRQELVCWRGCAFHHVPHSLISMGFQHPWTFGHPSIHASVNPSALLDEH